MRCNSLHYTHHAKLCFDTNTCTVRTRNSRVVLKGKKSTPCKSNAKDTQISIQVQSIKDYYITFF